MQLVIKRKKITFLLNIYYYYYLVINIYHLVLGSINLGTSVVIVNSSGLSFEQRNIIRRLLSLSGNIVFDGISSEHSIKSKYKVMPKLENITSMYYRFDYLRITYFEISNT